MSNPTRKLKASSNLSDVASAATSRTNLGATTVGGNFFTLTNPSAVRFPKINSDNTVTARTAAEFVSDIGAASAPQLYSENPSSPAPLSVLGTNSVAIGDGAAAVRDGEIAFGSGTNSKTVSKLILRASTTDATQTEMICGSGSSYLTIASPSSIVSVTGTIIALQHSGTELISTTSCYDWRFSLLASAKSASGTDAQIVGDVEISPRTGVSTSYSVDIDVVTGANARVRFRVTGAASENVEWVCNAEITCAIV